MASHVLDLVLNHQLALSIVTKCHSIYWSLIRRAPGNSVVRNTYSGPTSAQYTLAACCYAGTDHGSGGTVLGKL